MDIFGAPHAHHHSPAEVAGWFAAEGFAEAWLCNEGRRGFGMCGRLPGGEAGAPSRRRPGDPVSLSGDRRCPGR